MKGPKSICWSVVCNEEQTDSALDTFMKLLNPVTNKHAPFKNMAVKMVRSLRIDEQFKNGMGKREEARRKGK